MAFKRIILYPKDLEQLTGKSGRTCRRMLQTIREELGKSKEQLVTVRDFCEYYGMKEEEIEAAALKVEKS